MERGIKILTGVALAGAGVAGLAWFGLRGTQRAGAPPSARASSLPTEVVRVEELVPARSAPRDVAGPVPATPAEPEARPIGPQHDPSTLVWLRRVLPERYGALDDAALLALEELDLRGAELSDADLWQLATLPNLARLSLRGTAITDAGLAALTHLPLSFLDLRGTAVTGNCFALLPAARLEALHLTDTKVTEADLARLPSLPTLTILKLNFLALSDFTVETLAAQPNLRHVELDGTGLTDRGLRRLLALLPGVQRIEARNTRVSAEFVHELEATHPDLQVVLE